MNKLELGKEGEQEARRLLVSMGYQVQQLDWMGFKDGKWTCFEIKKKERFMAPPFDGTGLDKAQVYLRRRLEIELGIRTYLIFYELGTPNIYGQWLDILEAGRKYETKNGVIIYPLKRLRSIKQG